MSCDPPQSFDPFRKDFFCRIAEDLTAIDPLYEVPSSDRAVGVPIIVKSSFLCCPPKRDEIPLAIPKLWLLVDECFLSSLFQ